jgi:hypothetical protein
MLRLTAHGIVRNTTQPILALTTSSANRVSGSRLAESAAALARGGDVSGLAAGADVDGAGVGGVEVGGDRGLLGERQVRLDLVDFRGVGLHVGDGGGVALLGRNHSECVTERLLVVVLVVCGLRVGSIRMKLKLPHGATMNGNLRLWVCWKGRFMESA